MRLVLRERVLRKRQLLQFRRWSRGELGWLPTEFFCAPISVHEFDSWSDLKCSPETTGLRFSIEVSISLRTSSRNSRAMIATSFAAAKQAAAQRSDQEVRLGLLFRR